jgi:hypothetical protein
MPIHLRVAAIIATALAGCAGPTQTQLAVDKTVRPAWIAKVNRTHPEYLYVVGTCRGIGHRFLAQRCARADAQVQVRKATHSTSFRLEDSFVKEEHFERRRVDPGASKLGYDWWVLVEIPRGRLAGPAGAAASAPTAATDGLTDPREARLLAGWRALAPEARDAVLLIVEQLGWTDRDRATTGGSKD